LTGLVLLPAMVSDGLPDWPGARWVGAVDEDDARACDVIELADARDYRWARLLVRRGASVRGFADVPIESGAIDGARLRAAIDALPAARAHTAAHDLPPVTVVVCTRDRPALLRSSLRAIVALDYPAFDVLVVDNAASTTESAELVRGEFADYPVRVIEEPVAGISRARNAALAQASGEFVAFTDDDVVVDPLWLRELVAAFALSDDVECVSGLVPSGELRTRVQAYFDDRVSWSRNLTRRIYSLADPPGDLPMFPFSVGEFGTGANFALRRSAALDLGGFDTAFGVGTRTGGGEDLDMFTRVLLRGGTLVMQPSALVWHRHRSDLPALRLQARGYGTGLGAWLTKIAFQRATLPMVLHRSPHAIARLVSLAWRRPVPATDGSADGTPLDRVISRVGWYELFSVLRGPSLYLRQRLRGEGLMR
jgi:cellulose synthase/poly-beta-1,6-N-acetylglucosamine synthase-like glycosyltransferase